MGKVAFYYNLWQHGPTHGIRDWGWKKWLDQQWLKPAPLVEPRRRRIDTPTTETGVDDPRLYQ